MKTVKGIYAEAKIFTDDVEEYAEAQNSAPHGSGRRFKREDVKNQYTVSEYKRRAGIVRMPVGGHKTVCGTKKGIWRFGSGIRDKGL